MAIKGYAAIERTYQTKIEDAISVLKSGPSDNQTEHMHDQDFYLLVQAANDWRDEAYDALIFVKKWELV